MVVGAMGAGERQGGGLGRPQIIVGGEREGHFVPYTKIQLGSEPIFNDAAQFQALFHLETLGRYRWREEAQICRDHRAPACPDELRNRFNAIVMHRCT